MRSRENAARSRSKVSSNQLPLRAPPANQLPSQVAATQLPPMVVANQLPPRVVANQPISQASVNLPDPILDESVQEFSSSPRTEEPRKPKRRIAYGWLLLTLSYLIVDGINAQVSIWYDNDAQLEKWPQFSGLVWTWVDSVKSQVVGESLLLCRLWQ